MAWLGNQSGDTDEAPLNFSGSHMVIEFLAGTDGDGDFWCNYISWWASRTTDSPQMRALIFDESGGVPNNLLVCSSPVTVTAVGWRAMRMKKPIWIADGNTYFIGVWQGPVDPDRYVGSRFDSGSATGKVRRRGGAPVQDWWHASRCAEHIVDPTWSVSGFLVMMTYAHDSFDNGILSQGGCVFEYRNDMWSLFVDTNGDLRIYKNLFSSPVSVAAETPTTIHGSGSMGYVHACMDSTGILHVLCAGAGAQAREIAYRTFTLSSETWNGSWVEIYAYDQDPTLVGCAIDVDGSDIPHVLLVDDAKDMGQNKDQVFYMNRDGGSWSTPEEVSNAAGDPFNMPSISLAPAGDIEALMYNGDTNEVFYRRRNGAWGTPGTYPDTAFVPLNGVIVDTADNVVRFHITGAGDIQEDDVSLSLTAYSAADRAHIAPCLMKSGTLVFYIANSDRDLYVYNSYTGENTHLMTGIFTHVLAEHSYNYVFGYINVLVEDSNNGLIPFRYSKRQNIAYVG